MCDPAVCEVDTSLFGTVGVCNNDTNICDCPSGFSGVDFWAVEEDCHANDEFLQIIHVINLALYLSCIGVAALGIKLSWDKDTQVYLKSAKSKRAGVNTTPKMGSKKIAPAPTESASSSTTSSTDAISPVVKQRILVKESGLTAWQIHKKMMENNSKGKFFKLARLFCYYFIFGVLGSVYLGLAVGGVYHGEGTGVHDLSKGIASASFFCGLWQVVEIWHGAIPKSLFKGSENNPLHNPAFVRKMVRAHQKFFSVWFICAEFLFPLGGLQFMGDRLTVFGMGLCVVNFSVVMVLVTEDVRKMLQGAMKTTTDEGTRLVYVAAEKAAVFCLLLALVPVFFPDGSVWYTLCGASAVGWVNLLFLVYYGPTVWKWITRKGGD